MSKAPEESRPADHPDAVGVIHTLRTMPAATIAPETVGVLAALCTSVLWTVTGLLFAAATRRLGAAVVNASRLALAFGLHLVTFRLLTGQFWPEMSSFQLWMLVLSGVVGLALCDQCWLTSLADLGARRVMLLATTSPIFALALGAAFLGERIAPVALLGIVLTLGGVVWVVLERGSSAGGEAAMPHAARGTILAVMAAALQATGSLFSKLGMAAGAALDTGQPGAGAGALDPQAAAMTRMLFGLLGALPILAISVAWSRRAGVDAAHTPVPVSAGSQPLADVEVGEAADSAASAGGASISQASAAGSAREDEADTGAAATDRQRRQRGFLLAAAGSITGPYLGVWLSLVAFERLHIGVAQTLLSLQPVLVLPLAVLVLKDRVTPRAVLGALVAVAGSVVLGVWGRG